MEERQKVRNFTDLEAWKSAHALTAAIYRVTKSYPRHEQFGIVSQMRRAAVSVGPNLAEGFSRNSPKDKAQFYAVAKGSATELHNQLLVSRDAGYLSMPEYAEITERLVQTNKLITGLLKYLRALAIFAFPLILYTFPLVPVAKAATLAMPSNNLGLVGYWTFDEGTGTTAGDHSGQGNKGTLISSPTWTSGKLGGGLQFNGTSQYAKTGPVSITAVPLTICGWFKYASGVVPVSLLYDGGSTGSWWGWFLEVKSGVWAFNAVNNDGFGLTSNGAAPQTGQWDFVCGVATSNASRTVYVNGVAGTTDTSSITPSAVSYAVSIGAAHHSITIDNYFGGSIDDVRIYNRALSASEIAQLYQTGSARVGASLSPGSLASGLVGYWTFDGPDLVNNAADKSGQGNNGALHGFTSTTSAERIGAVGQALAFNGTSQYVSVPDNSQYSFGNGTTDKPFTVSAWVKMDASVKFRILSKVESPVTSEGEWAFTTDASGNYSLVAYSHGSTANSIHTTSNTSASGDVGKWVHIVATYDGSGSASGMALYRDGVLLASTPGTTGTYVAMSDTASPVDIGVFALGDGSFQSFADGTIDDVRIYSRALSASEITQLYNLGEGTHGNASGAALQEGTSLASGLVGYWTFDGPDLVNNVADVSGQGNTGYLVAAATSSQKTIGKLGQALSFNGSSQYVSLGTPASLEFSNHSFSVCAWVYLANTSNQSPRIVGFDSGGNNDQGYTLRAAAIAGGSYTGTVNSWEFLIDNGSLFSTSNTANTTTGFATNKWTHLCGVYDGSLQKLYVNGSFASSATPVGTNPTWGSVTDLEIASRPGAPASNMWPGYIDDVRIYSRALSASEVKQLYNLGH